MPTQSTTYNSRVTDEALEKRFRDTFRSQGGAELVDDLYAQGVIVPVVDFTAAATGDTLAEYLQTAWDSATASGQAENSSTTLTSTAGFWKVGAVSTYDAPDAGSRSCTVQIDDGLSSTVVWQTKEFALAGIDGFVSVAWEGYVFLRSGDSLVITSNSSQAIITGQCRQVATVSGDLVNPTGFTSS